MNSGLLQRLCSKNETKETETDTIKEQRQRSKGILSDNTEFIQFLKDETESQMYIEVSVDTLTDLQELDVFECSSIDGRRAIQWAKRYSENVEIYLGVVDTSDEFKIILESIRATEITNEMVGDFASSFNNSIEATFDPLGENHENPELCVRPW